jgi:hypothetical protein
MVAGMHWNTTDGRYHEALRRLAVVLLTLAVVSEGLTRRSLPVRCFVFWLLCRAETLARRLAAAAGAPPLPPVGYTVCNSCGPEEAARLAAKFRALATVFFTLSRQAQHWLPVAQRKDPVRLYDDRRNSEWVGRRCFVRRRIYADTS